jgi:TRAP-type C4-dicarboxylate transport system permease large subunit
MSTVFPIIVKLGFDPVWFGVLVVLMSELALITPPVGLNVYVTQAVTKVPLDQIFKANVPFMLVLLVAVVILIVFPQIALFLPTHMR